MIIAGEVTAGEVTAFIGPLIAAIGLIGGLIAWVMARTSRYVKDEITNTQAITNERIANLTQQLVIQGKAIETLTKSTQDNSITMARIEGKIGSGQTQSHSGP